MPVRNAVVIDPHDNVTTVVGAIEGGATVVWDAPPGVVASEAISAGSLVQQAAASGKPLEFLEIQVTGGTWRTIAAESAIVWAVTGVGLDELGTERHDLVVAVANGRPTKPELMRAHLFASSSTSEPF